MRFSLAVTLVAASVSTGAAFAPASKWGVSKVSVYSTSEAEAALGTSPAVDSAPQEIEEGIREISQAPISREVVSLTADEINARRNAQLEKLRQKDRTSKQLSKEVGNKKSVQIFFLVFKLKCTRVRSA